MKVEMRDTGIKKEEKKKKEAGKEGREQGKEKKKGQAIMPHTFIPALRRQSQEEESSEPPGSTYLLGPDTRTSHMPHTLLPQGILTDQASELPEVSAMVSSGPHSLQLGSPCSIYLFHGPYQ